MLQILVMRKKTVLWSDGFLNSTDRTWYKNSNSFYFLIVSFTNSLQLVERMENCRLPKFILDYKPVGWRDMERPRKRWKDSWAGTGLKVYALKLMISLLHVLNLFLLFLFISLFHFFFLILCFLVIFVFSRPYLLLFEYWESSKAVFLNLWGAYQLGVMKGGVVRNRSVREQFCFQKLKGIRSPSWAAKT
jgi:hypothetical protein